MSRWTAGTAPQLMIKELNTIDSPWLKTEPGAAYGTHCSTWNPVTKVLGSGAGTPCLLIANWMGEVMLLAGHLIFGFLVAGGEVHGVFQHGAVDVRDPHAIRRRTERAVRRLPEIVRLA